MAEAAPEKAKAKPKRSSRKPKPNGADAAETLAEPASVPQAEPAPTAAEAAPDPVATAEADPAPDAPEKPKRKGWWSLGKG